MKINIVYELYSREYENSIALAKELKLRGYDVKLYKKDETLSFRECDILIIPNGYNTEDFEDYCMRYGGKRAIVISMQYEQVLSKKDEDSKYLIPSGKALNAKWICWGKRPFERMIENGVPHNQLKLVGPIQMDFLRTEFDCYWERKEELAEKFNLPIEKKWLLFISSFAYVENENTVRALQECFGENAYDLFCKISNDSQKKILEWFEDYLENKEEVIIYRPHPIEANSKRLLQLEKKYPQNFRIISQLSVKQWIKVSDIITTWYSTSIAEVYFSNKTCLILRPVDIPTDEDATIFVHSKKIKTLQEFYKAVSKYPCEFPINSEEIEKYYEVNKERSTYKLIADYVDELIKHNDINADNYRGSKWMYFIKRNYLVKYTIKNLYKKWYKISNKKIKSSRIRNSFNLDVLESRADIDKINKKRNLERKIEEIVEKNYKL